MARFTYDIDLDANNSSGATGNDYIGYYTTPGASTAIADTDVLIQGTNTIISATISLLNAPDGYSNEYLQVNGALPSPISSVYDSNTGVLMLNGRAPQTSYQTAISQIHYVNTTFPLSITQFDRIIDVTVSDENSFNTSATSTIKIAAPNLDLDADNSSGVIGDNNYATTFTEGEGAVSVADTDILITSFNNKDIQSAEVAILNLPDGLDEMLSINGTLPAGISSSGYDPIQNKITLSGQATTAEYQTAINQIHYDNTKYSPTEGDRFIMAHIYDGTYNSESSFSIIEVKALSIKSYKAKNCSSGVIKVLDLNSDSITVAANCGECPVGYTYNSQKNTCERITTQAPTTNGTFYKVQASGSNVAFGIQGALLYRDATNRPFPITKTTSSDLRYDDVLDGNGTQIPADLIQNSLWYTNRQDRLTKSGVWNNRIDLNEWVGFSKCFDIPETRQYVIGMGVDNFKRISLNGKKFFINELSIRFSFVFWHLIPITLQAGKNVIEIEAADQGVVAAMGAEIYSATREEVAQWTNEFQLQERLIWSTRQFVGEDFLLGENSGYSCPEGYYFDSCADSPSCVKLESITFPECEYPIVKIGGDVCNCYDILDESVETGEFLGDQSLEEFDECDDCINSGGQEVIAGAVTKVNASMLKIPQPVEPDVGFKECCYDNLVLGDGSSDHFKNDFTGFFYQMSTELESCSFVLIDVGNSAEYSMGSSQVYGEFRAKGSISENPNLTTYIVDWGKVYSSLGAGIYRVERRVQIGSIQVTLPSNTFRLEKYTSEIADKSVRLECEMNGRLLHLDTDFKNSGFRTSIRTKGYFGDKKVKFEQDNIVRRDYSVDQITMAQENEYQYQTGLLPACITEEITNFVLFGNVLTVSDYNLSNHLRTYKQFPINFLSNKGEKYYVNQRHARLNLTFEDAVKLKRKINL